MHIGFGPWDVAVYGLGVAGVGLGPCGLGGGVSHQDDPILTKVRGPGAEDPSSEPEVEPAAR